MKSLEKPDFTRLITAIKDGVWHMETNKRVPKDFDHFVFEMAMEAIYGKDVWKQYNKFCI